MTELICGKVAAIVDDTTVVLNVGSRHGVHEGMLFAIVAQHQEIRDPETGESLGRWESVKGRVVVTHVQERMCTARAPLLDAEAGGATGTLSAMMVRHSFGLYGNRQEEREHLDVRLGSAAGRPRPQPIQVGDAARVIAHGRLDPGNDETEAPGAKSAGGDLGAPDLPSQSYAVIKDQPAPADAGGPHAS